MPKKLVICEKRSVADAISRALGGRFASQDTYLEGDEAIITWTVGQLAELAEPEVYDPHLETWRIEELPIVPERFVVVARTDSAPAQAQLKAIRALVGRRAVDRLVNACAAGLEGELVFAYVRELARAGELPVERAWFSSLTRPAIRRAFAELRPGSELQPLEDAARARAEADWLVGVNATRAATLLARALGGRITLGRVQTPTLALLVRRELEVERFEPVAYWVVEAAFEPPAGTSRYLGRWFRGERSRLLDEASAKDLVERVRDGVGHVRELTTREQRRPAPPLYDLGALQRHAAQWHGLSARRTLSAAQECYERAVLSYPCTASRHLPPDLVDELREIAAHVGQASVAYLEPAAFVGALDALPLERIVVDARVDGHHAVIPTNAAHDLDGLGEDARRIYDMVARRFLAAFFPPAVHALTTVISEVEGETFRSRGRVLLEAGWQAAYGDHPVDPVEQDDDAAASPELPPLEQGGQLRCARVESSGRETSPPPRLDDASLLAAMQDASLGTPAARAAIIERLIELGYAVREGRSLRPTGKGMQVIALLGEHEIASPELTGVWEQRLLEIEREQEQRARFMRDIAQLTHELVDYLRELPPEQTRFPRRDLGIVCPRCGGGTLIENRKGYGCSTWASREQPGCGFVIWKTIAGRSIDEEVVRELVERGRTRELAGFRSRAGKPFRATLTLDAKAEQPVTFAFTPRPGGDAGVRRRTGA